MQGLPSILSVLRNELVNSIIQEKNVRLYVSHDIKLN